MSALPLKADMRALASTKASGPEFLDLVRFDLGAPVSGPQRWLYLAGIEQVHPSGRSGDDQHGLGTCRLESVDLFVDVVRDTAQQAALVPVGQGDDECSLGAGDYIGVRPGSGDAAIHAEPLAEQCRTDHAGQR